MLTHYSAAILAPAAYDGDDQVTEVIGTGPYQHRAASSCLPSIRDHARSTDWRGAEPDVENVSFQAVGPRRSRARCMAASDQADVVFGLEPAGRERVESTDGVEHGVDPSAAHDPDEGQRR